MLKQPKYSVDYADIKLDDDFPFSVSRRFVQRDRIITRLHSHGYIELGYCWKGRGVFVVGGRVMPFKSGDIVAIPAGEVHLAQSVRGTTSEWNWVYFDSHRLLFPAYGNAELADFSELWGNEFQNVIMPENYPELCGLVKKIVEAGVANHPYRKERVISLLCLLSAQLRESFDGGNSACKKPSTDSFKIIKRLNPALQHMAANYYRSLSMDELAGLCFISPTHFRRLFCRATGKSPLQYLNHLRVSMAMAELKKGSRAISEIALDCGFDTLSSFNRQFKAYVGMSPREWRRQ